jgi:hypothetical protein
MVSPRPSLFGPLLVGAYWLGSADADLLTHRGKGRPMRLSRSDSRETAGDEDSMVGPIASSTPGSFR